MAITTSHPVKTREPMRCCPFCGKEPYLHAGRYGSDFMYWVCCENRSCGCKPSTDSFVDESKAIAAWNFRAGEHASIVAEQFATAEEAFAAWKASTSRLSLGEWLFQKLHKEEQQNEDNQESKTRARPS